AFKPLYERMSDKDFDVNGDAEDRNPKNKEQAIHRIEGVSESYERSAEILEARRKVYATMLAGTPDYPVLLDWELTRCGQPVPITEEELLNIKNPQIVIDLWNTIRNAADP